MKHRLPIALLFLIAACGHLGTESPASVDLSGTWVLDASRSDAPPHMGRRHADADAADEPRFGGLMPLLPMLTATQMTIAQDAASMGIAYPNQPYRDLKWGSQNRGPFKVVAGWEQRRLIVDTSSEPLHIREVYSLDDAGVTLTIGIDLRGREAGSHRLTRVFVRSAAPSPDDQTRSPDAAP